MTKAHLAFIRFGFPLLPDIRRKLPHLGLVRSKYHNDRRTGQSDLDTLRHDDIHGVRVPQFHREPFPRPVHPSSSDDIMVVCGQPTWVRLERRAEANTEEVHGKRKPSCLARDGIRDERAGRPPHHTLGLFCWIGDEHA